jgi:hypothetical protein
MENIQSKLFMIFRSLCAFIWFENIEKMLLQMTSGFLQLESTIGAILYMSPYSLLVSVFVNYFT